MNTTLYFSIISMFYCILLSIILKLKGKNNDLKIIRVLTLINLGTLLCEVFGVFLGSNYEKYKLLNNFVLRIMLILYASWFSFFAIFVKNIPQKEKKLNIKDNKIIYILMALSFIAILFLPMQYNLNSQGVITYSKGMAVDFLRTYSLLCEAISLYYMFKNVKNIKATNYASLFALISITTLSAVIQTRYPEILLVTSTETFVLYISYFNVVNIKHGEINHE